MNRVIKPFWSYDIVKTEKWLCEMAKKGYVLKNVNTITRTFSFEECEPTNLTYKICYENRGVNIISNSLKKEGWKNAVSIGKWRFIYSEKVKEEIKLSPSRETLIRRSKIIKNIISFIMLLYGLILLPFFLILTAMGTLVGDIASFNMEGLPAIFYLFNYTLQSSLFIVFLFGIFTVVKLNKLIKNIRIEDNMYEIEVYEEDIQALEKSNIIKKTKLGWFYSPDKTEQWLEDMESKGYNLCKVTKGNTFYFNKGESRKIKYILDYQNDEDNTYYEINSESGWKLNFKSADSVIKLCIWSKEYEDTKPEIYTDGKGLLASAKKAFITYTLIFVPMVFIQSLNIYSRIASNQEELFSISSLIYLIILIEFIILYKNILAYYIRTKKKVENI